MADQPPKTSLDPAPSPSIRRHVIASSARVVVATTLLVVAYFNVPLTKDATGLAITVFVIALLAFAVTLAYQIRRIMNDPVPRLRAAETLATAVPVFIVLFALVYAAMAQADPANFTQPVDRLGALYFTVTVLSTVGFGDIAARTDTARAIVTVQMLLDLVLIGVLVKVVIGASRIGVERRRANDQSVDGATP